MNALVAVALLSCVACSSRRAPGEIDFAIASPRGPSPRLHEPQVISSKVNLRQPLQMGVRDGDVTISFAQRGRSGITVAFGPDLQRRAAVTPFVYPATTPRASPRSILELRDGSLVVCQLDEVTRRIVAQAFSPDRTPRGPELAISDPTMDVLGPPSMASADGVRVLIAFFVATEGPFNLVGRWIDFSS